MTYPLPIDPDLGVPYCVVNKFLCFHAKGWLEFQSGKSMDLLIRVMHWMKNPMEQRL